MNAVAAPEARKRRKAPRAFRRRQIIDATVDTLSRVGYADATLADVARRAGMSQASLIFHFQTKDALLTETLLHLAEEYQSVWRDALKAAKKRAPGDPLTSICALAAADFDSSLTQRNKVVAWFAYWGESKSRPTYMRICGERDAERAEVMVAECAALLEQLERTSDQAADVAAAIDGLSDGLWQRLLMEHKTFGRLDALRLMFLQLRTSFPEKAEAIEGEAEHLWRRRAARGASTARMPGNA